MSNIIILITTHGRILGNKDNSINYISRSILQSDKSVYKLNAVTIGVPNIASYNSTVEIGDSIVDFINDKMNDDPVYLLNQIQKIIQNINESNISGITSQSKYEQHYKKYVQYYNKTLGTELIRNGEEYIDKLYYKISEDEMNEIIENVGIDENELSSLFNSITTFDGNHIQNILDMLQTIYGFDQIKLSELIDLVSNFYPNAKNIIIVDLSCSVTDYTPREERAIRREYETQLKIKNRTLGGRRRKKYKKRNNSEKHNKTRRKKN